MRNRRLKMLLLVCGALLCAIVYWAASPGEPRYRGQRISVWVENYPRFKQMDWRESEAAIRAAGTNGIPYIFQELRRRDSFTESMRAKLWFKGPIWVKRLVGPPKSRFDVSYVPEVFTVIGPASIPALMVALRDSNDNVRLAAISALGEFGPRAKDAIPAFIDALEDKNGRVGIAATRALGTFGPNAKAALPALNHLLAQTQLPRDRYQVYIITNSIARINPEAMSKPGLE